MGIKDTVLVTGGAGYIGSHVVQQLRQRDERVVVLDNLSTGFRQAVGDTPLIVGSVGDRELLARTLTEHQVGTVMHFAANTIVPESVRDPLKYYGNNTGATRNLLEACMHGGVRRFVFSSTAAVYGIPEGGIAREDMPLAPINPYGTSKLMSEWILRDLAAVSDFRYVEPALLQCRRLRSAMPHRSGDRQGDLVDQGGLRGGGRQAAAGVDLRHRLCDTRRHRNPRLHPRRGSGHAPTSTPSITCDPAAPPESSIVATGTATAFARCSPACSAWPGARSASRKSPGARAIRTGWSRRRTRSARSWAGRPGWTIWTPSFERPCAGRRSSYANPGRDDFEQAGRRMGLGCQTVLE